MLFIQPLNLGLLLAWTAAANPIADLLFKRAACNADNCLRAVTGTALKTPSLPSRSAMCSSFFTYTVTPVTTTTVTSFSATATVFSTTEIVTSVVSTETDTITAAVQRRDGTTVGAATQSQTYPAYAAVCSNVSRYSSACSCLVGTAGKRTVTAPMSTSTVTIAAVATLTTATTTTTSTTSTTVTTVAATNVPRLTACSMTQVVYCNNGYAAPSCTCVIDLDTNTPACRTTTYNGPPGCTTDADCTVPGGFCYYDINSPTTGTCGVRGTCPNLALSNLV